MGVEVDNKFEFKTLSINDINMYRESALVCNVSRKYINDVVVVQNEFDTDDMGGSAQYVDIFVVFGDSSELVDVGSLVEKKNFFLKELDSESGRYNLGGMIDLVESVSGKGVVGILVVSRVMSDFILDRSNSNSYSVYYSICNSELSNFLNENPVIDGWLVKKGIILGEYNFKEKILDIIESSSKSGELSDYNYNLYKNLVEGEGK